MPCEEHATTSADAASRPGQADTPIYDSLIDAHYGDIPHDAQSTVEAQAQANRRIGAAFGRRRDGGPNTSPRDEGRPRPGRNVGADSPDDEEVPDHE